MDAQLENCIKTKRYDELTTTELSVLSIYFTNEAEFNLLKDIYTSPDLDNQTASHPDLSVKAKLDNLFDVINSSIINKGGWFPSQMNITNIHGMKISLRYDLNNLYLNHSQYNIVEIIYESKFDEDIKEIPDRLYHLSISEYSDKIIKYGLVPKSKDKLTSHLDRIYLCKSIDDCENLINRMKLYYNDEKSFNVYNKEKRKYYKNTYPVIYEIDNSDKFIKNLYKDPNYDNGFYTLDNISPNKIKIIK